MTAAHGLSSYDRDVVRDPGDRELKLHAGFVVPTATEQDVFQALSIDYLTPAERNH